MSVPIFGIFTKKNQKSKQRIEAVTNHKMSQAGYPTYQSMSTGCSTHSVIHNLFVSMGKLVENYPRKFGSRCGIVLIKNWQ